MNRINPLLAVPLLVTASASIATALPQGGSLPPGFVTDPDGGGGATEPFLGLAGGTVFEDMEHGITVVRGGHGTVYFDPTLLDAPGTLAPGIGSLTGLAVMPTSVAGALEVTYVTNSAGLWRVDPDAYEMSLSSSVFLYGGSMAGAGSLQAVPMSSSRHVFGIATDGKTITSAKMGTGVWTAGPTCTFSNEVLDYVCIDFDGDGALEIAVLFSDWLKVYEQGWTIIAAVRAENTTVGALAHVRCTGGDRLAWATLDAQGDATLRVLTMAATPTLETPLSLDVFPLGECASTELVPGDMAAGDMDGDGEEDLVIMDRDSHRALVLRNQFNAPRFRTNTLGDDHQLLVPDDGTTCSTGSDGDLVAVADIDGDGLADVLMAREDTGLVYVFGNATDEAPPSPSSGSVISSLTNYDLIDTGSGNPEVDGQGRLNLVLDFTTFSTLANHVQVTTWFKENDSLSTPVKRQYHDNELWKLATDPTDDSLLPLQYLPLDLDHADAPTGQTWSTDHPHYYIRIRWVNVQPNTSGTPTVQGTPASGDMFALTLSDAVDKSTIALDQTTFPWMYVLTIQWGASPDDWHLVWHTHIPGGAGPTTKLGAILIDVDRPEFNDPPITPPDPSSGTILTMLPWDN